MNGHLIVLVVIIGFLIYLVLDTFLLYIPITNIEDDGNNIKTIVDNVVTNVEDLETRIPFIEKTLCEFCKKNIANPKFTKLCFDIEVGLKCNA